MGTCFLYGNGVSGGGLNFKVVGGTVQPANPKYNTIWVDTDTDISGWVFSAIQPVPEDGLVWVLTGDVSPVRFNAVRKNTIMVYADSVTQYVGGEWVKKSAYIWDREWVLIAGDLTIYNEGTAYVPMILTNAEYTEKSIDVSIPSGGNASVETENTIDITAYRKISVAYSRLGLGLNNGNCNIMLRVLDADGSVVASSEATKNPSGIITVDISYLAGNCTIKVYITNLNLTHAGACIIHKIILDSAVSYGDQSKITFSSFEVDDNGHLWIIDADQTSGAGFSLNEESGNLEATYG